MLKAQIKPTKAKIQRRVAMLNQLNQLKLLQPRIKHTKLLLIKKRKKRKRKTFNLTKKLKRKYLSTLRLWSSQRSSIPPVLKTG
jgi:hypothetical protein